MNGFGSPCFLPLVAIVAASLIAACSPRDEPAPRPAAASLPAPPPAGSPAAPAAPVPALQGVIVGTGSAPVAVLAEAGKAALLVPEGGFYGTELRVEQVFSDRAVLRRQSDNAEVTVMLGAAPATVGDAPAPPTLTIPADELPLQPPVPAAMDASGPPPGPGLTGPALPGPVSGR